MVIKLNTEVLKNNNSNKLVIITSSNHRLESAGLDAFEELCFESVTEKLALLSIPTKSS